MRSRPAPGVSLDARRDYRPRSWTDGDVSFVGGSLTFVVPSEIPVTAGASARGRVTLSFSLLGGDTTICVYRGTGYRAFGGTRYVLKRCRQVSEPRDDDEDEDRLRDGPSEPPPYSVSTVTADRFHLRVERGDNHFPATVVHLALPGPQLGDDNACTTDRCDPVTGAVTHAPIALDDGDECTTDSCDVATGPAHAPVDSTSCRGKANFHDRTLAGLGGNGRACADCHMPSERFQLTPAAALARFNAMTSSGEDDPLFRPIDANDFRINGAAAHDYTNLTVNGLIRVTIPLPPNVKLLDCGSAVPCPATARPTSETVADVWRSVPSIFNVNITGPDGLAPVSLRGPNRSGGYQLDGRIDTLQNQALAALRAHASVTVDPPVSFLDDVAGFQSTQFSSPSVQLLSDAMAAGTVPLPDPDPELDALETAGKSVFNRSCGQCHGNQGGHPSGSTPITPGNGRNAHRPHPLPHHRVHVPASGRHRVSAPLPVQGVQPEPDGERADLRDHQQRRPAERNCVRRRCSPASLRHARHDVGSGPDAPHRLPGARWPRRHRALRQPGPARNQQDRALLREQHRRHARRGARPLQGVLPARGDPGSGSAAPDHPAGRGTSGARPSVHRRRGSRAARLPPKDLTDPTCSVDGRSPANSQTAGSRRQCWSMPTDRPRAEARQGEARAKLGGYPGRTCRTRFPRPCPRNPSSNACRAFSSG